MSIGWGVSELQIVKFGDTWKMLSPVPYWQALTCSRMMVAFLPDDAGFSRRVTWRELHLLIVNCGPAAMEIHRVKTIETRTFADSAVYQLWSLTTDQSYKSELSCATDWPIDVVFFCISRIFCILFARSIASPFRTLLSTFRYSKSLSWSLSAAAAAA